MGFGCEGRAFDSSHYQLASTVGSPSCAGLVPFHSCSIDNSGKRIKEDTRTPRSIKVHVSANYRRQEKTAKGKLEIFVCEFTLIFLCTGPVVHVHVTLKVVRPRANKKCSIDGNP